MSDEKLSRSMLDDYLARQARIGLDVLDRSVTAMRSTLLGLPVVTRTDLPRVEMTLGTLADLTRKLTEQYRPRIEWTMDRLTYRACFGDKRQRRRARRTLGRMGRRPVALGAPTGFGYEIGRVDPPVIDPDAGTAFLYARPR